MRGRGDPEARAREWTQHLTDFMASVLEDSRGRPPSAAAAVSASAARGTQPGAAAGPAAASAAAQTAHPGMNADLVDDGGWLRIDLAPLLGRCGRGRCRGLPTCLHDAGPWFQDDKEPTHLMGRSVCGTAMPECVLAPGAPSPTVNHVWERRTATSRWQHLARLSGTSSRA